MLFSDSRAVPAQSRDRPNVFRRPPERAEYTTESEIEESEMDQTRHNRCGLLRPTAYSDSDRSVDSLVHKKTSVQSFSFLGHIRRGFKKITESRSP